ncbi:TNF Receptor Associated Factor (TRAF) [Trichostrongylus colubriformis]|uniref:TNF Receptor Associated Factor (TRAF) n=1 Tax=Trichostrongylus colubriformis TaxID=6319 RepID=A0AAN8IEP2_TRICO
MPCPTCKMDITPDSLKPDKKKRREVQSLLVKCPFARYGCQWCGGLKEMKRHADSCQYHGVPCPSCNKTIAEREMTTHLSECQRKLGICTYCEICVKATSMQDHLKICKKVIISCPFQCGLRDRPREEIDQHRPLCPNVDKACPFAELGCDYIGDKVTVQQHLAEEPIRHLMFLCDEVTNLKNFQTNMESEWSEMNERHRDILQRAITANEMYGAQLIWRIDNMNQRINEARSGTSPIIHSDPFVTKRYGYKFIASACLFGDGEYRGKYMAVYLTLVRGKYDALLQWPFDLTVCITLLDQNPDHNERCDISYRVDARKIKEKSEFIERPLSDKNGSFGAQTFCRLEVMNSFIRDDVMFLKFEVEPMKSQHILKSVSPQNLENSSTSNELAQRTPMTITSTELPKAVEETSTGSQTRTGPWSAQSNGQRPHRPSMNEVSPPNPTASPPIPTHRPKVPPVIVTEKNEIQESAENEERSTRF